MQAFLRSTAPFLAKCAACAFGSGAHQSWLVGTNSHHMAASLTAGCSHATGTHPWGKRDCHGRFLTQTAAEYPIALAQGLAEAYLAGNSRQRRTLTIAEA